MLGFLRHLLYEEKNSQYQDVFPLCLILKAQRKASFGDTMSFVISWDHKIYQHQRSEHIKKCHMKEPRSAGPKLFNLNVLCHLGM